MTNTYQRCRNNDNLILSIEQNKEQTVVSYQKLINIKRNLNENSEKEIKIVQKEYVVRTKKFMLDKFLENLIHYKKHKLQIPHQFISMKSLRESLKENKCVIHMLPFWRL